MLAILTTGHITITEHSALRRGFPALPPTCQVPLSSYVSSGWSPDNGSLYVATTGSVTRYDASGALVKSLWPLSDDGDIPSDDDIGSLAVKDKGTLILSMGSAIHILEHSSSASSTTRIVQTLPAHPDSDPVHALSLSHDGMLLAAASAGAVIVHNLALGTQTALRRLPGHVVVCTFHVHSRVRLLLGIGHELVIYDITRASGPSRVTSIGGGKMGDVVAVACSPYSKTLIAVACSEGYVALVDLDKELSLIRSFHYDVNVTSLLFSVDGASLYVGADNGKLLLQTLRSTEAPKIIAVGEPGCRVEGLAITKKTKLSIDNSKTTGSINSKPLNQHEVISPLRLSASKVPHAPSMKKSKSGSPTETNNSPSKGGSPPVRKRVNSATALGNRGIVSSVRNMFTNESGRVPRGADAAKSAVVKNEQAQERSTTPPLPPPSLTTPVKKPPSRVSLRSKQSTSTTLSVPGSLARERTLSGSTRNTEVSENKASSITTSRTTPLTRTTSAPKKAANPSLPTSTPRRRIKASTSPTQSSASCVRTSLVAAPLSSRRTSPASRRVTETSGGEARDKSRQAPTSGVERTRLTRVRPLVRPMPTIPKPTQSTSTRMPSPEPPLPSPLRETKPPFPIKQDKPRKKGLSMLGLATPEVERWIASKGEGSGHGHGLNTNGAVEFPVDSGDEDDDFEDPNGLRRSQIGELLGAESGTREVLRSRPLSVQITPRKAAWAMSPLRHSIAEGSPGMSGMTGLLHALVSDAMLDFRQETRAEMVGLHLDLVRMGRAWRREMRSAMQEYVGDLKELREDNRKLREENERLRRGY